MAEPSSELSSEACPGAQAPEEAESAQAPEEAESAQAPEEAESSTTTQKQKQPRRRSRRSSRDRDSFATYFPRVLKLVHDDLRLSPAAVRVMDSFVHDIFERIAEEAGRLARYTERSTITAREVQTAVRLTLPGEMGKFAVSAGNKAVLRYTRSKYAAPAPPEQRPPKALVTATPDGPEQQ
ncbi:histone H2B-like [Microcebus murinus]|uniref:histone H2B-like n=1 Tax=Microcebus murinus TaxID=30608 RepID=UPI003F6AD9D8